MVSSPLTPKQWRAAAFKLIPRALLGMALMGGYTLTQVSRSYKSSGTLVFMMPASTSALGDIMQAGLGRAAAPEGSDLPLASYEAVLGSDPALLAVAKQFDLARYFDTHSDEVLLDRMRSAIATKVDRLTQTIVVTVALPGTPRVRSLRDFRDSNGARERDRPVRELLPQLVLAAVNQMQQTADKMQLDRYKHNKDLLQKQAEAEHRTLDELVEKVKQAQLRLGTVDANSLAQGLTQDLIAAREALSGADAELAAASSAYRASEQQLRDQLAQATSLPGEVPLVGKRRDVYNEALDAYRLAAKVYGPDNPQVLQARARLELASQGLRAELKSAARGLVPAMQTAAVQVVSLQSKRDRLAQRLAKVDRELRDLPTGVVPVVKLQAELEQQKGLVAKVESSAFQAALDYDRRGVRWHMLNPPRVPVRKTGPRSTKMMTMGFLLGFFGLGLPVLRQLVAQAAPSLARSVRAAATVPDAPKGS